MNRLLSVMPINGVMKTASKVIMLALLAASLTLPLMQSAQAKPLDSKQAVALAKAKYPGKVLKTRKQSAGDDANYNVKIIQKNGKVLNVTVDGKTKKVAQR